MTRPLHRPEPVGRKHARTVDRQTPPELAAERIRDGERLMIADSYGTGVNILRELRALLPPPDQTASYAERKAYPANYAKTARRLLAPIEGHRVALARAPSIGFLAELYPNTPDFILPFADVQRLNSAWDWYQGGVHMAVLGHRVHPFFGTYVPARTSHLELFGTWLSQYAGPLTRAVDVGTGCGVLALMLCRKGFELVVATDTNPNAIESARREVKRLDPQPPIAVRNVDLLGDDTTPVDLVVFNPPWTRGEVDGPLDGALYFEDGLFERFFDQAHERLTPDGRVAIVFSNVIELVQPDVEHPIEAELTRGRFELVQKMRRKVKPEPSKGGGRRMTRERVEVWELKRA